ncbi:MAG: AAA family ATPase [Candidatus Krumholzibacteria bacterium]|nr:AAA family ATPase [Candidatus Krumholzibacteria bacterium]
MSKIIAICNNKGGVGKTTTVFHLAGAFSEKGANVLTVDLDQQRNLSGLFQHRYASKTIYNVLVDDLPIQDAIRPTEFPNISVVPASADLKNHRPRSRW